MKTILAITAAAMIASVAGHVAAQGADVRSVSVSYADLDLARTSGRETLERRIGNAVTLVCAPQPAALDLTQSHEYEKCRSQAIVGARQQVARVYDGQSLARASITVAPGKR